MAWHVLWSLTVSCSGMPRKIASSIAPGEVAEWLMAPVLKTGVPERVPGVRIPPSPPDFESKGLRAQKEKSYKPNR